MLQFDEQDIAVEALNCIEDYLNTIEGTSEQDFFDSCFKYFWNCRFCPLFNCEDIQKQQYL